MTRRNHGKAGRLGRQVLETMIAAPQVVAHRSARLLASGASPGAADVRELQRMGDEKIGAFTESWSAMAMQAMTAQWQVGSVMMQMAARTPLWWMPTASTSRGPSMAELTRWSGQLQSAALDVASAGLAPVRRRAVANASRLARRRP